MTTAINPRSLQIEAHYISTDVVELANLKAKLLDNGEPPSLASGLVGWLVDKAAGRRDLTAASTRSRYRRALEALGEPPERNADNPRSVGYVKPLSRARGGPRSVGRRWAELLGRGQLGRAA